VGYHQLAIVGCDINTVVLYQSSLRDMGISWGININNPCTIYRDINWLAINYQNNMDINNKYLKKWIWDNIFWGHWPENMQEQVGTTNKKVAKLCYFTSKNEGLCTEKQNESWYSEKMRLQHLWIEHPDFVIVYCGWGSSHHTCLDEVEVIGRMDHFDLRMIHHLHVRNLIQHHNARLQ